jgi:hypothetical protein
MIMTNSAEWRQNGRDISHECSVYSGSAACIEMLIAVMRRKGMVDA